MRAIKMKDKDIDDIMNDIGKETVPPDVYKMAEQMSRDFSESLAKSQQPQHHILFTRIATSMVWKMAAAAVFLLVFGTGFLAGRWSGTSQPQTPRPGIVVVGSESSMYPSTAPSEGDFWQQKARAMVQPGRYGHEQSSAGSLLDAYKQHLKEKYNG
jgi:hypothetical protein